MDALEIPLCGYCGGCGEVVAVPLLDTGDTALRTVPCPECAGWGRAAVRSSLILDAEPWVAPS